MPCRLECQTFSMTLAGIPSLALPCHPNDPSNRTRSVHRADALTPAARLSHPASAVAFSDWRGTRRCSVRRERRRSHDSREPIMFPRNVRWFHSCAIDEYKYIRPSAALEHGRDSYV